MVQMSANSPVIKFRSNRDNHAGVPSSKFKTVKYVLEVGSYVLHKSQYLKAATYFEKCLERCRKYRGIDYII